MGVVYVGVDGTDLCAVKVIRPDLANDPTFRARFRREITVARRVSSRYVANVIEADPDDDPPWMASELIDGPSLEQFVRENGILEPEALVGLATALAEGLDAIHRAGVVHRDLKPSNVLMAPDGPRIVDFGVAHIAAATALTATGLVIGSPSYMSPEQALDQPVTGASDVFSLASVIVFAASGRGPFGPGTGADVLYRVVHEDARLPTLPEPLQALVRASLAKDPATRPTPAQIRAALTGASDPDATLAALNSATALMPSDATVLSPPADAGHGNGAKRRRGALGTGLFIAAVVAVVAAAAIIYLIAAHKSKSTNRPQAKLSSSRATTTPVTHSQTTDGAGSSVAPPPPNLADFVGADYHVTSTKQVNLEDSASPQTLVTAVGATSIGGSAPSTVLLLAWDPIAKRWTTVFDASKQDSYKSTLMTGESGPGLLGSSDQQPHTMLLHDQGSPNHADLVYWLNSAAGNGTQLIVGVVHYSSQLAHLAWNWTTFEGNLLAWKGPLASVAVIGSTPHQQLKISLPWRTSIDGSDEAVRTYSFTIAPDPKYQFDQYSVMSDDRPLVGVGLRRVGAGQGQVVYVAPGSPADGVLEQGDIIDGVDGSAPLPVYGPIVIDEVAVHHPGDTIALDIERQGQRRVVPITLGEWKLPLGETGYTSTNGQSLRTM